VAERTPKLAIKVRSVLVEFVTIVVGVLVALAVDQWADDRAAQSLEGDYVLRLIGELRQDTADLRLALTYVEDKEESLLRLQQALLQPSGVQPDAIALLQDIGTGTNYAWNAGPLAGATTFEELQSSGNLRLIEDPEIRFRIIRYYSSALERERRIEARSTDFPRTSYSL